MGHIVGTVVDFATAHQDLAYVLAFLFAMSEALPVVGAFVPGSGAIIGLSALVASGALHLLPLIVWTTLGAISGDGLSYWLGHRYHREVVGRWPLSRHPELIARGDALIKRHGGKSVFIARFTPGVRAIVPLIAGILQMSPARFYSMNVLSAALWAPSHILAGALIGASLTLLGAVAGRLAMFLVVLVVMLWAVVWILRRAWRYLPSLARGTQAGFWLWVGAKDTPVRRRILWLLDPARTGLPALAISGVMLVGCLWAFFEILENVIAGGPLARADAAVFQFLQTLRTIWADQVMVAVAELGDGIVTIAVAGAASIWVAWRGAWRTLFYWLVAIASAILLSLIIEVTLHQPKATDIYLSLDMFSPRSSHMTVSTALYGFLTMLIVREVAPRWQLWGAAASAIFLSSVALSRLYLGAYWLSDVLAGLAFGTASTALLSIAYLRRDPLIISARGLCAAVGTTLALIGWLHIDRNHAADMARYAIQEQRRIIAAADWWQHGWADLPARRFDLGGELEEPLTVQWAGDLSGMQDALLSNGWRQPVSWNLQTSLAWITPRVMLDQLPVLPRLLNGRLEALVLVHPVNNNNRSLRLVLHVWPTNVDLRDGSGPVAPLWIGTVAIERKEDVMSLITLTREQPDMNSPRDAVVAVFPAHRLARRENQQPDATWDRYVLLAHGPNVLSQSK